MNNDFPTTANKFDHILREETAALAGRLKVQPDKAEQDGRIIGFMRAGKAIVDRALNALRGAESKSPYHTDRTPFLDSLATYEPQMESLGLHPKTYDYDVTKKSLQNVARTIGQAVAREQAAAAERQKAIERASNAIRGVDTNGTEVSETSYDAWLAAAHAYEAEAVTIPAALELSEAESYQAELKHIRKIVENASRFDLQQYVEQTLLPRAAAINALYEERRAQYEEEGKGKASFQLDQLDLIDFRLALGNIVTDATVKAQPPTIQPTSPYPELTGNDRVTKDPQSLEQRLATLKSNLVKRAETMPAAELHAFYKEQLAPTIAHVESEIAALKQAGDQPKRLAAKQQHLTTLREGADIIMITLTTADRVSIPTLHDAIENEPAHKTSPKRPSLEQALDALRSKIDEAVATRSGDDLRKMYDNSFKPKIVELVTEINRLKAAGNNNELLAVKQKHLDVVRDGAKAAFTKMTNEAEAARDAEQPLRVGMNPPSVSPLAKALLGASARRGETSSRTENYQVRVVAPNDKPEIEQTEAPVTMLRKPSAAAIASAPYVAENTKFKEILRDTSKIEGALAPQKPWWKRAAIATTWAVGGVVAAGGLVFAGLFLGTAAKIAYQDHVTEAKIAKAHADFNNAAQADATIIVSTPANANSPVAAAAPVAKADVPAPAAKVADTGPVKAAFTDADNTSVEAPKAKRVSTPKAKADFRPAAAANDVEVTYKDAIIAKPFDIATSRVGADVWKNACAHFEARGVKTSVCPS